MGVLNSTYRLQKIIFSFENALKNFQVLTRYVGYIEIKFNYVTLQTNNVYIVYQ